MIKTKEIKEIREIKPKVKIIREIERERNKQESNFNEFLEIDRLRFLQTRKKTLNKNKAGEKLDSIIDDESIKDENKAREDLERNREDMDNRADARRLYGSNKNDDSRYYGGNQQQANTTDRSFIGDGGLNRQGINQGNENNLRQTGNNTNYERNYVQDENKDKKKRDLM